MLEKNYFKLPQNSANQSDSYVLDDFTETLNVKVDLNVSKPLDLEGLDDSLLVISLENVNILEPTDPTNAYHSSNQDENSIRDGWDSEVSIIEHGDEGLVTSVPRDLDIDAPSFELEGTQENFNMEEFRTIESIEIDEHECPEDQEDESDDSDSVDTYDTDSESAELDFDEHDDVSETVDEDSHSNSDSDYDVDHASYDVSSLDLDSEANFKLESDDSISLSDVLEGGIPLFENVGTETENNNMDDVEFASTLEDSFSGEEEISPVDVFFAPTVTTDSFDAIETTVEVIL